MLNVNQEILNEIAQTIPTKYRMSQELFSLDQLQVAEAEEKVVNKLVEILHDLAPGQDPEMLAMALWEILPLYLENEAISRFVEMIGDHGMRAYFPQLDTPTQVIQTLLRDRPYLTVEDQKMIAQMLIKLQDELPRNQPKMNSANKPNPSENTNPSFEAQLMSSADKILKVRHRIKNRKMEE